MFIFLSFPFLRSETNSRKDDQLATRIKHSCEVNNMGYSLLVHVKASLSQVPSPWSRLHNLCLEWDQGLSHGVSVLLCPFLLIKSIALPFEIGISQIHYLLFTEKYCSRNFIRIALFCSLF